MDFDCWMRMTEKAGRQPGYWLRTEAFVEPGSGKRTIDNMAVAVEGAERELVAFSKK
jgi:hypothetical protein